MDHATILAGFGRRGCAKGNAELPVNKISWQKVGGVSEPGRYKFAFGWLTITSDDLVVGKRFPNAVFTLVNKTRAAADAEEFHLGTFDMGQAFSQSAPHHDK
jgi:hypothetical protein